MTGQQLGSSGLGFFAELYASVLAGMTDDELLDHRREIEEAYASRPRHIDPDVPRKELPDIVEASLVVSTVVGFIRKRHARSV